MNKKPKLIAITGSSATGKSELAINLAMKYNGEIVSADSRYIYRELDICTAKPSPSERNHIPHYLIDICDLTTNYTAGNYVDDAFRITHDILLKGKLPIVVGGTGLYFKSFLGTFDIPEIPPDLEFRKSAENISSVSLYSDLLIKDPVTASKLHPNNKVKIVRALEICNFSGNAMSDIVSTKQPAFDILWLGLAAQERKNIYFKAEKRVDIMLQNGIFDEAVRLFHKYGDNRILLNTIGCKEFYDCIFSHKSIDDALFQIKQNTRHYIKRQISWFSADKNIKNFYVDIQSQEMLYRNICNEIEQFLD